METSPGGHSLYVRGMSVCPLPSLGQTLCGAHEGGVTAPFCTRDTEAPKVHWPRPQSQCVWWTLFSASPSLRPKALSAHCCRGQIPCGLGGCSLCSSRKGMPPWHPGSSARVWGLRLCMLPSARSLPAGLRLSNPDPSFPGAVTAASRLTSGFLSMGWGDSSSCYLSGRQQST